MKLLGFIGITGLVITICLNLAAMVVFKRYSAEYFSSLWWTTWFPNYIVWFTFTVIGIFGRRSG